MRSILLAALLAASASNSFAYINGKLPGESRADYESRMRKKGDEARIRHEQAQLGPYNAAVAREPDSALALYQRGLARERLTTPEQRTPAMKDLDEAIRLDPKAARFYCARARVRIWIGKEPELAFRDLDRAVEVEPDYVPALVMHCRCYAHADIWKLKPTPAELKSALRSAGRACELAPDNLDARCAAAAVHASVGDYPRAAELQAKAVLATQDVDDLGSRRMHLEMYQRGKTAPLELWDLKQLLAPERLQEAPSAK